MEFYFHFLAAELELLLERLAFQVGVLAGSACLVLVCGRLCVGGPSGVQSELN